MLSGKTVVVGVCGGIAAYKAVDVISRLKKLHAEVHVIMTENAAKFVTPLTFQAISHNPVTVDMFSEPDTWDIKHVSLAEKADLFLIAPATGNVIGKIAAGIADDMLTTSVMAAKAPVLLAPAMNHNMYENPIVQSNISKLKSLGYIFIEPETGMMACGTVGKGRLPQPEVIVESVVNLLSGKKDMKGLKVLVTAGPTQEAIDPVRYITNRSSGRMGFAFAHCAVSRGAQVKLVCGPVNIPKPYGIETVDVVSAAQMYEKVSELYKECDIVIFMAAVADYRCEEVYSRKIKKEGEQLTLKLVKNPDIARELGKNKGGRIFIGACAETDNLVENAMAKLESKNFDIIMANDVTQEGAGFGVETNIVTIVRKDGTVIELPLMSKKEVADRILDEAVKLVKGRISIGC